MGPVLARDVDPCRFLLGLEILAKTLGLSVVYLGSSWLPADLMVAANFRPIERRTFILELGGKTESGVWASLTSKARTKIRKAQRAGLAIERAVDEEVADEYYDRLEAGLRAKGVVPAFKRHTPRQLISHLMPDGRLIALRVRDRSNRTLAVGLFPHDARTVYFWGGASYPADREFCPNDLLQWGVIRHALALGLGYYDMLGDGAFKKKFGGERRPWVRWQRFLWGPARWASDTYERYARAFPLIRAAITRGR
jgi:hypothetical protein